MFSCGRAVSKSNWSLIWQCLTFNKRAGGLGKEKPLALRDNSHSRSASVGVAFKNLLLISTRINPQIHVSYLLSRVPSLQLHSRKMACFFVRRWRESAVRIGINVKVVHRIYENACAFPKAEKFRTFTHKDFSQCNRPKA